MIQFKLTDDLDFVLRLDDNALIPRGHRWWREYEEWLTEGNTPEPADPPPKKPTPVEEVKQRLQMDRTFKAINAALAKKFSITEQQMAADIEAEAK